MFLTPKYNSDPIILLRPFAHTKLYYMDIGNSFISFSSNISLSLSAITAHEIGIITLSCI